MNQNDTTGPNQSSGSGHSLNNAGLGQNWPGVSDTGQGLPHQPIERGGTRTGPIVWGVLILGFCCYIAQRAFPLAGWDTGTIAIVTILSLGILLLGIGVIVLMRNQRAKRDRQPRA
ncbi:hypothetical protein JOF28_000644 [Leucobacter exalbidus]|uniref:Uncharacterized protein n=1 Tax=Leucobacter exalbidus TaxID=662960 RepID=A0A940T2S9_9MICO|nr:hypothetical protein [Leucobacter exalbidus]MBP1325412.1 hypothetical protein [Leucobacter exalbidus]